MMQTFQRTEDDELAVEFAVLVLAPGDQDQGVGAQIVRNSMIVYDHLGVRYASAYANFDKGGYVWAKLGGAPVSADACRESLLERLQESHLSDLLSAADVETLAKIVRSAPSERLMFDLANAFAEGDPPKPLGKPFLLGYQWDAFWDLTDDVQRQLTAGALIR